MGKLREVLDRANEQTLHAGKIIHRLREFIAKRETARRVENAAKLIEEASALALVGAKQSGIRARLVVETSAHILVDRVQIQQVLVNLVRNAVEAMATSARKELEVRVAEASGMVEVSVSDTGAGLAPEIVDRLFAPFASTKSQGMGIGLSVCRAIVEAHGGGIRAEPNCGRGTTFRFTIPAVPQEQAA